MQVAYLKMCSNAGQLGIVACISSVAPAAWETEEGRCAVKALFST